MWDARVRACQEITVTNPACHPLPGGGIHHYWTPASAGAGGDALPFPSRAARGLSDPRFNSYFLIPIVSRPLIGLDTADGALSQRAGKEGEMEKAVMGVLAGSIDGPCRACGNTLHFTRV